MKLRAGVVIAVVAALFGAAGQKPEPLPIALVASFDEAISLATAAAEAHIARLERQPVPPERDLDTLLARFEANVAAQDAFATSALDIALARLGPLPAKPPAHLR